MIVLQLSDSAQASWVLPQTRCIYVFSLVDGLGCLRLTHTLTSAAQQSLLFVGVSCNSMLAVNGIFTLYGSRLLCL